MTKTIIKGILYIWYVLTRMLIHFYLIKLIIGVQCQNGLHSIRVSNVNHAVNRVSFASAKCSLEEKNIKKQAIDSPSMQPVGRCCRAGGQHCWSQGTRCRCCRPAHFLSDHARVFLPWWGASSSVFTETKCSSSSKDCVITTPVAILLQNPVQIPRMRLVLLHLKYVDHFEREHQNVEEEKIFQCVKCSYRTGFKNDFEMHWAKFHDAV